MSARPDPEAKDPVDDPPAALWRLPPDGGEAALLTAPDAGVRDVLVAGQAEAVVLRAEVHPGAEDLEADRDWAETRRKAGVSAMLLEGYPIRHWDRWLGPREPALWVVDARTDPDPTAAAGARGRTSRPTPRLLARGPALHEVDATLSPDGRTLVTGWRRTTQRRAPKDLVCDLATIDLATGQRRELRVDGRDHATPAVSPDGQWVACVAATAGSPQQATRQVLLLIDLVEGTARELATNLEVWPISPRWLPDGQAIVFVADHLGHRPVFRVEVDTDEVSRLTACGAYSDLAVTPDGSALYALHNTIGEPPHPVTLDTTETDQQPTRLPAPVGKAPQVASVERLVTTAPTVPTAHSATDTAPGTAHDTAEVAAWLVLPRKADGPVPLVTFLHGGPLSSWNGWHWRWNPHVLASTGYAVLLPDPALSTGYGQAFIERGWGRWGQAPYTDVLALVEAAAAHPAVDADRLAVAGGSFGGYLANWIAGQTDRFRAVVSHASLWSLRGFHGTTDAGLLWEREFGDPYHDASRYEANSPDQYVAEIATPMLVIHGEQDLRVPISEAVTLWTDLMRHGASGRFLYLPDEHHWVLRPANTRLWYDTVVAFLDEHLRDEPFRRPALL